jgi:signal transduction histidine kinase
MAARSIYGADNDESDEPRTGVMARSDVWHVRLPDPPEPGAVSFAVHDAKNMMGVLAANLEVLTGALAGMDLPARATDALGDMSESARRLSALLREALAGLQGCNPRWTAPSQVHVGPVLAAGIDRMRPAARARGVLIVNGGTHNGCATIEPGLLERVIVNLLENAVRFSRAGDTIEVECVTRGGRMTLAVSDRGPGVPEDACDEIFESYRHRPAGGTESHFGLGLAFCREVARAHGGDAWVFNRAGGGACFVFETESE